MEVLAKSRNINLTELKRFVEGSLPPGTPLREVIILDDDELSVEAFLTKLPVWLRLNKLNNRR